MGKVIQISFDHLNKLAMLVSGYTLLELVSLYSFNLESWAQHSTAKTLIVILPLIVYTVSLVTKLIKAYHEKEERRIKAEISELQKESVEREKKLQQLALRRAELENELLQKELDNKEAS